MENTISFKVDFMRKQLHKELDCCTSLTDNRVVMASQLLDEFIVENQKQINSKKYQQKLAVNI